MCFVRGDCAIVVRPPPDITAISRMRLINRAVIVDGRIFIAMPLLVDGYGTDLLAYTNDPTMRRSYVF